MLKGEAGDPGRETAGGRQTTVPSRRYSGQCGAVRAAGCWLFFLWWRSRRRAAGESRISLGLWAAESRNPGPFPGAPTCQWTLPQIPLRLGLRGSHLAAAVLLR